MQATQNNPQDIGILLKLVGVLSAVQDGHYPANPGKGCFQGDPLYFDPENKSHLQDFYNQLMGLMDAAPDALFKCVYTQQLLALKHSYNRTSLPPNAQVASPAHRHQIADLFGCHKSTINREVCVPQHANQQYTHDDGR
jgi:hypothetical protein